MFSFKQTFLGFQASKLLKANSLSAIPQKLMGCGKNNNKTNNSQQKTLPKTNEQSSSNQNLNKQSPDTPSEKSKMTHQRSLNTLNSLLAPKEKLHILHDDSIYNEMPLSDLLNFENDEEAYAFIEGLLARIKRNIFELQDGLNLKMIEKYDISLQAEVFAQSRDRILLWFDDLRKRIPLEIRYLKKWVNSLMIFADEASLTSVQELIALHGIRIFLEQESKSLPISQAMEGCSLFNERGIANEAGSAFSGGTTNTMDKTSKIYSYWKQNSTDSMLDGPQPQQPPQMIPKVTLKIVKFYSGPKCPIPVIQEEEDKDRKRAEEELSEEKEEKEGKEGKKKDELKKVELKKTEKSKGPS